MEGHVERKAFLFLTTMLGFSIILYLIFVIQTTVNIVGRKNLENANRAQGSRVNELVLSYLSESNKINLGLAYSLGFKDSKNTTFASLVPSAKPLSFAPNN